MKIIREVFNNNLIREADKGLKMVKHIVHV